MNKKTLKIAGWALGLSMAVAGVGTALSEAQTAGIETEAASATWDASEQGYTNAEAVAEATIDSYTTITFTSGGTATAYYDTGTAVRVYNGGTFTISCEQVLSQIVLTYELNGAATLSCNDSENWDADTNTWTGSSNSVTWTAGSAKHVRLRSVSVTYQDPKSVKSLSVKNSPKTTYFDGDSFDPTGLVITATYSDDSTSDVAYSGNEAKFSFTPNTSAILREGDDEVVIGYGGSSVVLPIITNAARTITNIAFFGDMAVKDYAVGDSWDYSGLQLMFTWSAGDPTYVTLDDAIENVDIEITASPAAPAADTTAVTLNVTDHLYEYDGAINPKTITSITVVSNYEKVTSASGLVVGDSYVIGVDGLKSLMGSKASGSYREVVSASSQMNDERTMVDCTLPSGAVIVTLLQGTASGKYYIYDITNNKYLKGSTTNTNLTDANSLSDATDYEFSYSGSNLSVEISPRRFAYNKSSPRFASYNDSYGTSYYRPVLFRAAGSTVKKSVATFTKNYLMMSNPAYDGDITTVDCASNYETLKAEYAKLTDAQKNILQYSPDFESARARMVNWAKANHETFRYGEAQPFVAAAGALPIWNSEPASDSTPIIITILSAGALAIGGLALTRKRRNED